MCLLAPSPPSDGGGPGRGGAVVVSQKERDSPALPRSFLAGGGGQMSRPLNSYGRAHCSTGSATAVAPPTGAFQRCTPRQLQRTKNLLLSNRLNMIDSRT